MKTRTKRFLVFLGLMVASATVAAGWYLAKVVPIGTGYVAKYICSSVFISGREDKTVFEEDVAPVNPLARIVTYTIDREAKRVRAHSFGLFSSVAVYREGCGCTLAVGISEAELRKQPIASRVTKKPDLDGDLPWPGGNGVGLAPLPDYIDRAKLEKAIAEAFEEEQPGRPKKTRAVLVVYKGQLVAERYAPGFHRDMPLLGWSMSKSVTNALVGILVKKGKLVLESPAPVPEWQGKDDPRRSITLDQLLRMSSGLEFDEVYAPLHDATNMLYGSADFAAYAAAKPLQHQPDEKWSYASGTSNIIGRIIRQTLEPDYPNYYTFIREELFDKIGMRSAVMEPDPSGTIVASSYTLATPRDWARFALLYLQDGLWRGERILPTGWVKYTVTPTPQAPQGEYGAHFWLNAGAKADPGKRRWPSAPRDAYSADGFQEQKVIIIPSRDLILVRFGATSDRKAWDTDRFIAHILAAFPPK